MPRARQQPGAESADAGESDAAEGNACAIIAAAARILGGAERLAAWVREDAQNEKVFWGTVYPKLLSVQDSGEGGGGAVQVAFTNVYEARHGD